MNVAEYNELTDMINMIVRGKHTIVNNSFVNFNASGGVLLIGKYLDYTTETIIENNLFKNIKLGSPFSDGSLIFILNDFSNNTVNQFKKTEPSQVIIQNNVME